MSKTERLTGIGFREQGPVMMIGLGHAGVHWLAAVFYVLLPFINRDLGFDYTDVGLLVAIFHVTSFATNFVSGPLVDLTGRRVLWQSTALMIGALAFAAFGLADSLLWLALMVMVIGAANNLWHPAAITYLSVRFPRNRGYALSIHGLGANLGEATAPLFAGALLITFTWGTTASYSALPVVLLAVLFPLILRRAGAVPGAPAKTGDYLAGIKGLLKNPSILKLLISTGLRANCQIALLMFIPLYLADVLELSPLWIGMSLAVMQMGGVAAAPVAGILSDRIGRRRIIVSGLGLTTTMILLLTVLGNGIAFVAGTAILGFGLYAVRPVTHSWAMDMTPDHLGGSMSSLMFGAQSGLSILAPLIGGVIADAFGLLAVFYFIAFTVFLSNIAAWLIPAESDAKAEIS